MVRRIENASKITNLNESYIMKAPQDKVIKDIDEIADINKSIIFQPETKRATQQKHKKKRTKKDILENSNKRKEKQNGFLPPDVAAMQADVEFIKQQIAQSARSKESYKNNKSNQSDLVKAKITNKERAARERENRKQFGFKNPLRPNKLEMIDYVNAQREARKSEDKLKSRTITKPLINKRKQSQINKLYKQMTIKNIDNNRSRNSTKTINAKKAEEKGKIR